MASTVLTPHPRAALLKLLSKLRMVRLDQELKSVLPTRSPVAKKLANWPVPSPVTRSNVISIGGLLAGLLINQLVRVISPLNSTRQKTVTLDEFSTAARGVSTLGIVYKHVTGLERYKALRKHSTCRWPRSFASIFNLNIATWFFRAACRLMISNNYEPAGCELNSGRAGACFFANTCSWRVLSCEYFNPILKKTIYTRKSTSAAANWSIATPARSWDEMKSMRWNGPTQRLYWIADHRRLKEIMHLNQLTVLL